MAGNIGEQMGASAKDALGAVSSLVLNPVGGLSPAYTALGPDRALGAGLALCGCSRSSARSARRLDPSG